MNTISISQYDQVVNNKVTNSKKVKNWTRPVKKPQYPTVPCDGDMNSYRLSKLVSKIPLSYFVKSHDASPKCQAQVLRVLCDFYPQPRASIRTYAQRAFMSVASVKRALAALKESGFIEPFKVPNGYGFPCQYKIYVDKILEAAQDPKLTVSHGVAQDELGGSSQRATGWITTSHGVAQDEPLKENLSREDNKEEREKEKQPTPPSFSIQAPDGAAATQAPASKFHLAAELASMSDNVVNFSRKQRTELDELVNEHGRYDVVLAFRNFLADSTVDFDNPKERDWLAQKFLTAADGLLLAILQQRKRQADHEAYVAKVTREGEVWRHFDSIKTRLDDLDSAVDDALWNDLGIDTPTEEIDKIKAELRPKLQESFETIQMVWVQTRNDIVRDLQAILEHERLLTEQFPDVAGEFLARVRTYLEALHPTVEPVAA